VAKYRLAKAQSERADEQTINGERIALSVAPYLSRDIASSRHGVVMNGRAISGHVTGGVSSIWHNIKASLVAKRMKRNESEKPSALAGGGENNGMAKGGGRGKLG